MLEWQRLRRGPDIRGVYGSRRVRRGNLINVHWRPNDLGHPRVAFSISAKVGGSVERNLVKRRLREIARPRLQGSDRGVDIVVVVRPAAVTAPFAALESEFGALSAPVLGL